MPLIQFFCCYWFNYGYGCGYGRSLFSFVTNENIPMGLESAIGTSVCSDTDKITELNTAMATGMDLDKGVSPILPYTGTLNETTPIAMDIDTAAASDLDTDRDGITVQPDTDGLDPNIGPDSGSDIGPIRPSGSATSNLEEGMTMPLDPNMTSETGSDKMDMTTAIDTTKDSESLDPNVASDKGSDTFPIQLSASATAMASVTATQDSDDNHSRFSKGSSSEENEFTDDDDVTKAKKNKN
jgi:hypothetical protein